VKRGAALVPLALLSVLLLEARLLPPRLEPEPGSLYEWHVLANRGAVPRAYTAEQAALLLASTDPLRRDYALTWDLTRHAGSDLQRAHLEALDARPEGAADAAIGRFFLDHQVKSPDLAALRAYFEALARRRAGR
jgi:hypothetical protein